MAESYELTTEGNVAVRDVVFGFDKKSGVIWAEFDFYGKDWTSGAPYPQAILQSDLSGDSDSGSYAAKTTTDLTVIGNYWKRHRIEWAAGAALSLKDWGEHDIKLIIHDEDDTAQTFTGTLDIDLTPNEYYLTNTTSSLGDSSNPVITWTLKDLLATLLSTARVLVGGNATGSVSAGSATGLSGGIYLIKNDTLITSINWINFNNSDGKAGKTFWDPTLLTFTITSPAMTIGDNNYSIDLGCVSI